MGVSPSNGLINAPLRVKCSEPVSSRANTNDSRNYMVQLANIDSGADSAALTLLHGTRLEILSPLNDDT
jgi:hypothetical protein